MSNHNEIVKIDSINNQEIKCALIKKNNVSLQQFNVEKKTRKRRCLTEEEKNIRKEKMIKTKQEKEFKKYEMHQLMDECNMMSWDDIE